jgi:hypothetical protein
MAALPRHATRRRQCDGKQPFPSRVTALGAMFAMLKKRGGTAQTMSVYRCRVCSRPGRPAVYHYGHRPGATWSR